jgi:hypothetical protein
MDSPFRLDEYDHAGREFFNDAVEAIARAESPVLSQIGWEKLESVPTSQHTFDSGTVVRAEPTDVEALISFSISESVDGNFDSVDEAIAEAGQAFAAQLTAGIFAHISELCDAAGTASSADELTWDAVLEMYERVEISFDEDGNPSLPSLHAAPETVERLGDPPDDFVERCNQILIEKRNDWLASRRTRRLPR